jgi:hypothetical protein
MRTALSLVFAIPLALTLCGSDGSANSSEGGCRKVHSNLPTVYIDNESPKGRSGSEWFQLVNNSSDCAIVLPTASASLTKLPDGGITTVIQDGEEVKLLYEVEGSDGTTKPAFEIGHGGVASHLPPGRSVYFRLRRLPQKRDRAIIVPFEYEWDRSATIRHTVRFAFD